MLKMNTHPLTYIHLWDGNVVTAWLGLKALTQVLTPALGGLRRACGSLRPGHCCRDLILDPSLVLPLVLVVTSSLSPPCLELLVVVVAVFTSSSRSRPLPRRVLAAVVVSPSSARPLCPRPRCIVIASSSLPHHPCCVGRISPALSSWIVPAVVPSSPRPCCCGVW